MANRDDFDWNSRQRVEPRPAVFGSGEPDPELHDLPLHQVIIGHTLVDMRDPDAIADAGELLISQGLLEQGMLCCGRPVRLMEMVAYRRALERSPEEAVRRWVEWLKRQLAEKGIGWH